MSHGTYLEILELLALLEKPVQALEIGVLGQHSADALLRGSPHTCLRLAPALGGPAKHQELKERYVLHERVSVLEGSTFETLHQELKDESLDWLHVDIANDGEVFRRVKEWYWPKVRPGGLVLLEGGSEARDRVSWMTDFGKTPIVPVLWRLFPGAKTIGKVPALTITRK